MALTVDDILERIGSLGLYQIRLILILSYIEWFNMTFQVSTSCENSCDVSNSVTSVNSFPSNDTLIGVMWCEFLCE